VVLASPLKTRAIASARIKTDKVDARILAHLLRGDLVAECYVPSRELREIRAPPFKLPLERELWFEPRSLSEIMEAEG
jgi:hypothetical protein